MSLLELTNPHPINCQQADEARQGLRPYASLTNYLKGDPDFGDPRFPAVTSTTWMNADEVPVLHEELDADGCRHWIGGKP